MDRKRPLDSADNQGQVFARIRHSEVVESIASMNGFDVDIDPTERQEDVALKKGSKHYEIVKGLANLNNREFWVDYSLKKRKWILHWKKIQRDEMRPGFVFRYNHGDEGTLLEANPEYGLRETVNSATILVFDDKAHRWVSVGEFHDIEGSTDPKFTKGGGLVARSTASKNTRAAMKKKRSKSEAKRQSQMKKDVNTIKEAMDSPSAYRIAASGFAIDVLPPPGRRFKNSEEASRWMLRWFQAKQDNFITVSGTVIGVESLRARQIHTLKGLSSRLDGNYYFTRVRHRPDANDGYYCEFTANRVVTG
jgi:phage protein D